MTKLETIMKKVKALPAADMNWAELSNAIFDPQIGILAGAFPTRAERAHFMKSPEYREIRKLIEEAMARTGVIEGATPRKSGKFVVRLPSSLHAALEREATDEGVSLNQLVVAKLAVQLKIASAGKTPMSTRQKSA